jgi:endonuclease G
MCNNKKCNCTPEFDAESAYKRLRERHNELAEIFAQYLTNAKISDRKLFDESAQRISDVLPYIIGGVRVSEGEYPECCLVGYRNNNNSVSWFCTGVLVHPRIILTAGHCFKPGYSFTVALNAIHQDQLAYAEIIDVKKAVQHIGYQQTRKFNDITVLVLSRAALTPPVNIAATDEINSSESTRLVGFGNDHINNDWGFGIKRTVDVPITSIRRRLSDPLDADEIRYDFESDIEFVAGGNGYDSCKGDSGGPAYIYVNGSRKLAGLTSRATAGAVNKCGEGGIYTRVDMHLDFIQSLIP